MDRSDSSRGDAGAGSPATDTDSDGAGDMDPGAYLNRIDVEPSSIDQPDFTTLERLQAAHVRTVPFETLAITGDPRGLLDAGGVDLALPTLYEKLVDRTRGGYCFELNGLFCWLLRSLGYDARRVAARVLGDDGDPGVPANHHSILVDLGEWYVTDVGLGTPKLRRPVPLDGGAVADGTAEWRVVPAQRSDEDYRLEMRTTPDEEWAGRYVFTDTPRDLGYFRATNDYLQTAPESPFTGAPYLSIATERGYVTCSGHELTTVAGEERTETTLSDAAWYDRVESTFGLRITQR